MSRTNAITACVASAALAVVLLVVLAPPRRPRAPCPAITEENFRKLKRGMSRAEVEAILAAPPGDYGRGGRTYGIHACQSHICSVFYNGKYGQIEPTAKEVDEFAAREGISIWWGKELAIAVIFDEQDKADSLGYGSPLTQLEPEPDFWGWIEDWFDQ